ncbi:hypothetical protein CDAR_525851 [Caerostris darwini]|uniref:Uncharacterized protein n=1 Tax=Caerostris darwini TaxID=1538125 RepID=A0AAV4S301_9ARAC|nr:hypothetical protein CDAR_525851 [Caerostris darwini]
MTGEFKRRPKKCFVFLPNHLALFIKKELRSNNEEKICSVLKVVQFFLLPRLVIGHQSITENRRLARDNAPDELVVRDGKGSYQIAQPFLRIKCKCDVKHRVYLWPFSEEIIEL